jgi:hypothetical protein
LPLDPRFAIRILSTFSFGGEYSRQPPVIRFYGMLKIFSMYERDTSKGKNSKFRSPVFLLCYRVTAGRISRELWLTSRELSLPM